MARRGWLPVLLALALTVALALAGCASDDDGGGTAELTPTTGGDGGGDETPGVLRLGTALGVETDPALVVPTDQTQMLVADLLYDGLTLVEGADGPVQGALAETWEHEEEFTEWTFTLRDDAEFSDGSPVTATDVKASLERVVARGPASLAGVRLVVVEGYEDFVAGDTDDLEGLVVIDEATVAVSLVESFAPLPELLASPLFGVLPAEGPDEDGFFDAPVGSGPMVLVDHGAGEDLLEAADERDELGDATQAWVLEPVGSVALGWSGVEVYRFEAVSESYEAFTEGGLDWSPVPRAEAEEAVERYGDEAVGPFHTEFFFGINVGNPALSDRDFREAIVRALDREALGELLVPGGIPLQGVVVEGVPGHVADPCGEACAYDPEAAEELLGELFGDGDVPEVQIDFFEGERERAVAEAVVEELAAVGIPASLRASEVEDYKTFVTSGDQEIFLFGWVGIAASADSYLAPLFLRDSPDNVTGFGSSTVDAGVAAARTFESPEERAEAYEVVEAVVMGQLPVVPLVQVRTLAVVSERVSGWEVRLDGTVVLEAVSVAP
jgi:oligopeptide transport system substrate-binding protein